MKKIAVISLIIQAATFLSLSAFGQDSTGSSGVRPNGPPISPAAQQAMINDQQSQRNGTSVLNNGVEAENNGQAQVKGITIPLSKEHSKSTTTNDSSSTPLNVQQQTAPNGKQPAPHE